ncbi:MAG: purine-nucleoside phosphorylase [Bacteroidota bacterium]
MEKLLQEACEYIRRMYAGEPEIGIILGTGLGGLVDEITIEKAIPYNFIPNFPISTVQSHFGRLIFGEIHGKKVVAMQGRFHYYEGYSMQQITFPVRVLKMLGIHTLFVSNASGALNLDYQNGDLVILDDHINLQPENPLVGPNLDEFGPRFPSMARPYDPEMIERALAIAEEKDIRIHKGIYVSVSGPNLETRAEYRYMRIIGGDVVGMSTVPEVLVARHMNLRVCAISVVTDIGDPEDLEVVTLADMIDIANEAEPRMTAIFTQLIKEL